MILNLYDILIAFAVFIALGGIVGIALVLYFAVSIAREYWANNVVADYNPANWKPEMWIYD